MQVVLSLTPGGTERLVIEICRRLQGQVRTAVCCLDEPGDWAHELRELGIPVHALRRRPGFRPGLAYQIGRLSAHYQADVLHCHHYSPFVYGVLASRLSRRLGVVFTEHGRLSDAAPSRKRRSINPLLGRLPASIFAVSEDLKQHMVAEGFPAGRVGVIHNGIETGPRPAADARAWARAELGLAGHVKVVGTIGRLDPVKNLPSLLEAHRSVVRRHPDSHLVIVGDGPERAALEAAAGAAGLSARVRFAGYRSDARDLLAGFDVYVNSSVHEGVSLTVLEAMAALLPVVATRVGGNPEVVVHGETGLLVPAKDASALGESIDALLVDVGRSKAMGESARRRVQEAFSIDRMVDQYRRAYERERQRRFASSGSLVSELPIA